MAKYRKRPVVIEAVQLQELTFIQTLEGTMQGNPGDWLIIGVNGERYPCKDEIFRKTYEPVEEAVERERSTAEANAEIAHLKGLK